LNGNSGNISTAGNFGRASGGSAVFNAGTSTLTLNGGSPTLSTSFSYFNLTIAISGTLSNGGSLTVNGDLTISSGTLSVTSGGSITGAASKTFSLASVATYKTSVSTFGVTGFGTYTLSGTVEYGSTAISQTIDQNKTYTNLTLTGGGGTKTAGGNLNINGNFLINLSATYSDSGFTTNLKGNWTKNGAFTSTGTVNFNGTSNQSISGSSSTAFAALVINNTGTTSKTVTLSQDISDTSLNIMSGIFDQGTSSSVTSGAVTVSSGATFKNVGTGDLTLSGNVTNSGTINYDGSGAGCGSLGGDSISINSSDNVTQRSWSGTGSFSMTDVTVSHQGGTAIILVRSGTDIAGTNGPNWVFVNSCTGGGNTYTWNGTISTDYQIPANWSPSRVPNASDTLIFDGSITPSPTVTNVPTEPIASLQVINGAFVDMSTNASNTLTISGGGTAAFSVGSGNSLTLSGTNALRITVASGSTGLVTGFMKLQQGAHQLTATGGSTITFSGSDSIFATVSSYNSSTNPFGTGADGTSSNNSIIFASASTYIHNNGDSPFGPSGSGPVVVFQTGSTANWLTSNGFQASGRTYANLNVGQTDPGGVAVALSASNSGNFKFDNLTINGKDTSNNSSLTVTDSGGASAITIQGNITSSSGTNDTTNDVSFTAGSSGIVLNTVAAHTFSDSGNSHTITFGSNATVQSSASLTLQRNLIVSPTSAVLSIRGTLNAGPPSYAGYVIGNLLKPVSGDTTFEVGTANGYSPASLLSVTGSGDFTIRANQAQIPNWVSTSKVLQRYWSLTNGGGVASAKVSFKYLNADVPVGTDLTKLKIIKDTNFAQPITFPEGSTDNVTEGTNTATTANPVSTFSNWSAAESNATTVVKMESFGALGFNNGNLLKWQTGFEVDNLGFNVYRMAGGKLVRITPSIVAGSALMAGRTALTAGLSYSWFDPKGLPDSAYYVEDIDLSGKRTMHGPVTPEFAGNVESPSKEQAMLLSQISNTQADSARFVTSYPAAQATATLEQQIAEPETTTAPEETPQTEPLPIQPSSKKGVAGTSPLLDKEMSADSARESNATVITRQTANERSNERSNITQDNPLAKQRTIAAGSAVKIAVRKAGWYRVTQAELIAAGLDPNASPVLLQLYADGVEQPIQVRSSNEKLLSADAYIEFYGMGMDTLASDTRTYWLIVGSLPGKRINGQQNKSTSSLGGEASMSVSSQDDSPKLTMEPSTAAYSYTVERRDKIVYFNALLNGEADNFFGPVISKTPAKQDMTLSNIDASTSSDATLDLALQGVTMQAHKVRVVLNGFEVGVLDFNNVEHPSRQFQIPRSSLVEGNNSITLASLNGDSDINLVDYVRLTYLHTYRADNDQLTFTSSQTTPVIVEGFTSPQVRIFDITNPNAVTQVNSKMVQKGTGYAVKVAGGGGSLRTLLAVTESQVQHPAAININEPSNLSGSGNRADFIILTHRNFRDAVKPLADLRRSQGLETMVVDVEDVYDEFSYGAKSPAAIKDFLGLAQNTWTLAPRYALFVGDASYDPRNYQGFGGQDLVPTKLVDATTLETASDDALADFDGDGIADIAVGRLPVQTAQQAQLVIGKIVNYSPGQTNNSALLVSDHLEGYDFEAASNLLRTLLPQSLSVTMVNRSSNPTAQVKNDVINGINAGPLMVNYAGHGSTDVWTGASILSSSDAAALTNGNRLPLFVSMTCLNGRFQDSNRVSLAEALMKATNGGAVAVWASSGLTEPDAQSQMDQQLMRLLFADGQSSTLGDAVRGAKHATNDQDLRKTWILFGDPTMRIR
jgi:hypothetical protein